MKSKAPDAGHASLLELGCTDPSGVLATMRDHLAHHGAEPYAAVRELARRHRLVCLGEMHDLAGRFMSAELVSAAAQGGARLLFVEVYADEQAQLDRFVKSGRRAHLPLSVGGGPAAPLPFQQPYVDMLMAARAAGMRIIAFDAKDADYDERNHVMALTVEQHLLENDGRGVAVVGQLHLVARPVLEFTTSMAGLLRESLGGSVVTVGRAVPDVWQPFSVWSDVADVEAAILLRVDGSPFESLASNWGDEFLVGSDFDHILFYPAAAVGVSRGC